MKYLRSIALSALLFAPSLILSNISHAQPTAIAKLDTAVAFVKVDRTQLWVKRSDTAGYVVFKANANNFSSISNLAYLDQTRDGRTLLLAGKFRFVPPWNLSQAIDWTGAISVPTDSLNDPHVLDHVKFLKTSPYSVIRPVGAVTPDHKWFVAFNTTAQGVIPNLKFYHGSLDSSYNVGGSTADQGLVIDSTAPSSSDALSNWKLSNISVSPDGKSMVAAATQEPDDPANFKFYLYYWHFGDPGGPFWRVDKFTNYQGILPQKTFSPDTLFGASIHVIDGDNAEIGLTNASGDPNIHYYTYRYTGFTGFTISGRSIDRSSIPSNEFFFSGRNDGTYSEDVLSNQTGQHALGGDVTISKWNADDALFITHEAVPPSGSNWKQVRDTLSEVYRYDFSSGTATKVYNDLSNQELQPQFMLVTGYETHYPKLTSTQTSLGFGTVDSGIASTKNITLSNSDAYASTPIDSIVLHAKTNYSIALPSNWNLVAHNGSITIPVTFKPIETTSGPKFDTLFVYWNDTVQHVMSINLSGIERIAQQPPPKSVREEDPAMFAMTVQPNPFLQSARISVTSPESGSIAIVVHDALGREVFASGNRKTSAGQSEEFTFDAKNLGLPVGTYYVTALLGDRAATREVVFVK